MPAIERRREERFLLEIPSVIKIVNGENREAIEMVTKDVCSGGAFFHTDTPVEIGTSVKVDLVIPVYKSKKITPQKVMITVDGIVIRARLDGMAVRFDKRYKILPIRN